MIANMEENPIGAYPIVRARRLTKTFGDFTAVNDVDIDVPCGGCFGLLGPNGAGKTTTLRMILGQTHPSSQTARLLPQVAAPGFRKIILLVNGHWH